MELFKRDRSPFFYVEFTDGQGVRRRVSTKCRDRKSAQTKLAEIAKDLERRAGGKADISLDDALGLYVGSMSANGRASASDLAGLHRKAVGKLVAPKTHPLRGLGARCRPSAYVPARVVAPRWHLPPTMPLSALTARHIETLIQERRREGLAAATIGHEIKLIRAASIYAKGLGYLAPSIDNWRVPKCAQKTRYLSPEEFKTVLTVLKPGLEVKAHLMQDKQDAYDLLIVLVMTGGRWSEIASLTWSRVDWAEETVTLWGNKTQQERPVALPPLALETLRRRAETRGASPYVFPGDASDRHRKGCRPISEAIDKAGLNSPALVSQAGRATIHSLRHTYASWLLAGGADLSDVQAALGHTTLSMTRRYAHLTRAQSISRMKVAMGRTMAECIGR